MPHPRAGRHDVLVVVPAYGRSKQLGRCLASLHGLEVTVVDDGSPATSEVEDVVKLHAARLVRHAHNRGPAAARNSGWRDAATALVAFVDSDCEAPDGWLDGLVPHFDDPKVAAVAPRIMSRTRRGGLLARFEVACSALDMGRSPELVRPDGRLTFVPTATLVVRRSALDSVSFDETLHFGEDVDLVWRLVDHGWHVRYDPTIEISHESRTTLRSWGERRYRYGRSATGLARKHPGRLAPLRISTWSAASLTLIALGQFGLAGSVSALAAIRLHKRLGDVGAPPRMAAELIALGLLADGVAVGHTLRREWWPLGALGIVAARRSRIARLATAAVLGPVLWEWLKNRPALDPLRYTALRLLADALYGTGVLTSAVSERTIAPLRPSLRGRRAASER
jgi:mycofactocin system glycosyltransferase